MPTGYVAHPTLDGLHLLGLNPQEVEVAARQVASVRELATGGRRWQGTWQGPGLPDLKLKHSFRIGYDHVRTKARLLGCLLSRPGVHTFTLWRAVEVSWTGDGERREFLLPWRLAPHVLSLPPQGPPAAELRPWVSLDPLDAAGLIVTELEPASYETAQPAAGEAVFERGGRRFRLAEPPAAGAVVYAALVPLFEVLATIVDAQRLGRVREPRTLVFEEL